MKKPINDTEYLAVLQDYYAQFRVLPSYARLTELFGFASKAAVKKALDRLAQAGMLDRTPDGDWAPSNQFFDRFVVHQPVPAGVPVTALDDSGEQMTIDRFLIEEPSKTVLIKVKGDSMINAGIHSGDLAVVQRRSSAEVGEKVVAIVDDEFTLKILARDALGFHLQPANPDYPLIRATGSLEIFGVVVGLIRKYQ